MLVGVGMVEGTRATRRSGCGVVNALHDVCKVSSLEPWRDCRGHSIAMLGL